jgi:hypothetical protein
MSTLNRAEQIQRIAELRKALAELEYELDKDIQREQHEAIDHLDSCFEAVESKLTNLKTFWRSLKEELHR